MFDHLPATRHPRGQGRSRALLIAVAAHAAALLVVAVTSSVTVEAVVPPSVPIVLVTFSSPPAPPPPPGRTSGETETPKRPRPPIRKDVPVQPEPDRADPPTPAEPAATPGDALASTDAAADTGDGTAGGDPNGVNGGVNGSQGPATGFGPETGAAPAPIRVTSGVEPPRLVHQVKPEYPRAAAQARIEGTVYLEAIINTAGAVEDVKVLRGHPLLDRAALEAALGWRFEPGRINGRPVRVHFTLVVKFVLH